MILFIFVGIFLKNMNLIIILMYFNGKIYEGDDGVTFKNTKKII